MTPTANEARAAAAAGYSTGRSSTSTTPTNPYTGNTVLESAWWGGWRRAVRARFVETRIRQRDDLASRATEPRSTR